MKLNIDRQTDLLTDVLYIPSPNCDQRPTNEIPSLIVIHGISLPAGEFGGPYVEQLFTNQLDTQIHESFADLAALTVSAHLFIRRNGEIIQFVPFSKRAWHAGKSNYKGREACNDYSIGIELEGTDEIPYTDAQYMVLSETIRCLQACYPGLERQHIAGHSDIAPGRKTDPGQIFDWQRLNDLLDR
jgi:AmpD protein